MVRAMEWKRPLSRCSCDCFSPPSLLLFRMGIIFRMAASVNGAMHLGPSRMAASPSAHAALEHTK
eukprot:3159874-Alexandrium_andersonii.AAC.1